MKKILAGFAVVLFLLAVGIAAQNLYKNRSLFAEDTATLAVDKTNFTLEVAKNSKDRQIGLSKKSSLADNQGMIFIFEQPAYHTFWMKNMKFPIDIIFVLDNKVTTLYKNVQPPKEGNTAEKNLILYPPKQPSDKVVEINAGLSDKYGISEGDTLKLTL